VAGEHGGGGADETARRVRTGSTVRVLDVGAEEEDEYVIVRRARADVARGRISEDSPVGRALLGRAHGEEVVVQTPGGVRRLTVIDVSDAGES
jgi:transcription elongation factor GreA